MSNAVTNLDTFRLLKHIRKGGTIGLQHLPDSVTKHHDGQWLVDLEDTVKAAITTTKDAEEKAKLKACLPVIENFYKTYASFSRTATPGINSVRTA